MPQLDPKNDLLPVFDKNTGLHSETTPFDVVRRVLMPGTNIAFTQNADGTLTLSAAAGGGGGGGGGAALAAVAHDDSLVGDGTVAVPLAVAQATEAQRAGAQIITQAEANASRTLPNAANDTDILTIAKLLNLGGNALDDLRALIASASSDYAVGTCVTVYTGEHDVGIGVLGQTYTGPQINTLLFAPRGININTAFIGGAPPGNWKVIHLEPVLFQDLFDDTDGQGGGNTERVRFPRLMTLKRVS